MKLTLPASISLFSIPLLSLPVFTTAVAAPQSVVPVTDFFASDISSGARFGTDVAIDKDLIVVGAWGDASFRGSAYVLRGIAGDVTEEAKLVRSGGQPNDLFGRSVDVSSETVVVGASRAEGAAGRAIVFERSQSLSAWTQVAELSGSDSLPLDEMGLRVAIDRDVILAGAPRHSSSRGAAYVFRRVNGIWTEEAKLSRPTSGTGALFGIDVCVSGDRALVGACGVSNNRGTVSIFEYDGTSWSLATTLQAVDPIPGDLFGISVAFDGSRAVIGAPRSGGGTGIGFLQVYGLRDGSLQLEETLEQGMPFANSGFGNRVDVSGDFIVASRGYYPNTGNALLFALGDEGFRPPIVVQPDGLGVNDTYSGGVDVISSNGSTILLNGGLVIQDGIIVAGARLADFEVIQAEGRVYVSRIEEAYSSFCASGEEDGCGACPCGNDPPSSRRASGCQNSTGEHARLLATGTSSMTNDTLHMQVVSAAPLTFGLLVSGHRALPLRPTSACAPGSGAPSAFSDGLRCVGGGITRHGTRMSDAQGSIGVSNRGWGNRTALSLMEQSLAVAGSTIFFQALYRDDIGRACGSGQNSTNGVRVLCLP